jgi:hypothetical protein
MAIISATLNMDQKEAVAAESTNQALCAILLLTVLFLGIIFYLCVGR